MLSNVEMVPKECGFNQSTQACRFCARLALRFTCLPATARYGELIQMQHSFYHVETIEFFRGACAVNGNVQLAGHVKRVDNGAAFDA